MLIQLRRPLIFNINVLQCASCIGGVSLQSVEICRLSSVRLVFTSIAARQRCLLLPSQSFSCRFVEPRDVWHVWARVSVVCQLPNHHRPVYQFRIRQQF